MSEIIFSDNLDIDMLGGTSPNHPLLLLSSVVTGSGNVFASLDWSASTGLISVDGGAKETAAAWNAGNYVENVSINKDFSYDSFLMLAMGVYPSYLVVSTAPNDAEEAVAIGGDAFDYYGHQRPSGTAWTAGAVESNPVTTTTTVPATPTITAVTTVGSNASHGAVSLSWTYNLSNETGFEIERATGTGTFGLIYNSGTSTATSWTDTTVASGTLYSYEVLAYDSAGSSPLSTLVSVNTSFTGTIIGTPGSYMSQGNTITNVFDGLSTTFFDAPTSSGSWVGLNLGSPSVITTIFYEPRPSWAQRMVGGVFQGSNSAFFTTSVTLYTISTTPGSTGFTTASISVPGTYQYVRYVGPAGSFCDIAEAQFIGNYVTAPESITLVGGAGYGNIYLKNDGNTNSLDVWQDTSHPGSGSPTEEYALSTISNVAIAGSSEGQMVTVDYSTNDPLPSSGLSISETFMASNVLQVIASPENNTMVFDSTEGDEDGYLSVNGSTINFSNVAVVHLNPAGGTNSLSVVSGYLVIPASEEGGGIVPDVFSTLAISSGATLAIAHTSLNHGDRKLLEVSSLSIASTGMLDLSDNDLVIHNGNLGTITSLVAAGINTFHWDGYGINSSAAGNDTTHLTALGTILNNNGSGVPLYGSGGVIASTFDGVALVSTDVLVKYTYYGDTNLDGQITSGLGYNATTSTYYYAPPSDGYNLYVGSSEGLTGWYNGDFNYDGSVNGTDWTLFDNAFNSQGTPL